MSCKFSDINGYCTLFDEDFEQPGCDSDGVCICEDDEDPSIICEDDEDPSIICEDDEDPSIMCEDYDER